MEYERVEIEGVCVPYYEFQLVINYLFLRRRIFQMQRDVGVEYSRFEAILF